MSMAMRAPDAISRIGRFPVEGEIARNATGVVYRGLHPGLRLPVAIKVFTGSVARDPAFIARFRRETAAIARLGHPGVIRVYDVDEYDGALCVVTECFAGQTLRGLLADQRRLGREAALGLLQQLAEAVGAVHSLGIVHGHLKPENVLVGADGRIRVVDFGISHLLHDSGQAAGGARLVHTGAYLAPEQVLGQAPIVASDIYSLGCLLYEMVDGQPPFRGSVADVLHAHLHQAPTVSPYFDGVLWPVVARALAKDPAYRFRSCRDLLLASRPLSDGAAGSPSRLPVFGT